MAKAIYGHTGGDARLAAEVARLRARVRELEAEVTALREAIDSEPLPAWDPAWLLPGDALVPDPR